MEKPIRARGRAGTQAREDEVLARVGGVGVVRAILGAKLVIFSLTSSSRASCVLGVVRTLVERVDPLTFDVTPSIALRESAAHVGHHLRRDL